jgi:hypothetical protein
MTTTTRGAQFLETLAQPHIHALVERYGQPPQGRQPDDPRRARTRTDRPQRAMAPHPRKPTKPPRARRLPPTENTVPPDDLHRALAGQGGRERLGRFAVAMAYPTLTEAAHALGVSAATLIEQLQRLERDVGTQLFRRATPATTPHRPRHRTPGRLHAVRPPASRPRVHAPTAANRPARTVATRRPWANQRLDAAAPHKACWTRSAFGRFSEARVIRVRS